MIKKEKEKKKAIQLRKSGLSYSEILKIIPVAKSTLSVWLREVGIAKRHIQRLTEKRRKAQLKARETCRNNRISSSSLIVEKAKNDIRIMNKRDLFLAGAMLYWAEGCKQKEHNVSQRVSFGNSDPEMILLFDRWLKEFCNCSDKNIVYQIYLHETADKEKIIKFWEKLLKVNIDKVYYKKHNVKTNRKNTGNNYNGLLRIDVEKSTNLNRKIHGWILGIIKQLNNNGA